MSKRLKAIIRTTSFVLAFVFFFLTATSTYASNAHADAELNKYQEQYRNESFTVNGPPEVSARFLPALPWIGMGIADLIGWLAAGAATVAIIHEAGQTWAKVNDVSKELTSSKKEDKPKFFVAKTVEGGKTPLYIGRPLQEGEAETYLKESIHNNVWAPYQNDAKNLAMRVGQGHYTGPEIHWETGKKGTMYYWHYHGGKESNRVTGHIFYGVKSFEGKW
ncbi:hypothetical protein NDS46_18335 [Paenibacillus thiaminolyticus]|uniref:hypothetical protein n=1 Tax=Paenibacillus thiaminolyticus TaxID=49283 RepID=UPI00232C117A|nr:hypothetical protein [Paenibacillus thiaminolyticus]WCF06310.1 hypothetical protein NDS46_18335 [Paenibacillus thiaminolyticus]WII35654.1 hypothetical protein O0V01_18410 [Paenibacillus thiaminolyticus]